MNLSILNFISACLSLVSSWNSHHPQHHQLTSPIWQETHRSLVKGGIRSFRDVRLSSTVTHMVASSTSSTHSSILSSLLLAVQSAASSLDDLHKLQRFGENIFAGILSVAMLQGIVALGQYRTNPSGQLIVPTGPTIGIARPKHQRITAEGNPADRTDRSFAKSLIVKTENATEALSPERSTIVAPISSRLMECKASNSPTTLSKGSSRYARVLNNVNRWLVLLVPWVGRQFSSLMARNTHLFHVAFIFLFSRIFDLPHHWLRQSRRLKSASRDSGSTSAPSLLSGGSTDGYNTQDAPFNPNGVLLGTRPIRNLIVLGDSLAVGLGSVDVFDTNRNNTLDFQLIQNLDVDMDGKKTGPVFPRVLAETIADREGLDVAWRSAGVDGGDTQHILDFCLDVLEEEVQRGRSPDLVVLLCGINDLKYYMPKPWWGGNPGPRAFRKRLQSLIDAVHRLAPESTIVLPAIPTQMFHKNSPINIFPFNFVMDSLIGFWDSLKMGVADRAVDGEDILTSAFFDNKSQHRKGRVIYVRTNPKDVLNWYKLPNPIETAEEALSESFQQDEGLIAADGVHPNRKCYALWAQSLANQLLPQQVYR